MNRIRVLFSLALLVVMASLASAGSFGPRTAATAGGSCPVDMSACPSGPDCCPVPCPLPCAPDAGADAAATVAAR